MASQFLTVPVTMAVHQAIHYRQPEALGCRVFLDGNELDFAVTPVLFADTKNGIVVVLQRKTGTIDYQPVILRGSVQIVELKI